LSGDASPSPMPVPTQSGLEERVGERRPFSAANLNFFTASDPLLPRSSHSETGQVSQMKLGAPFSCSKFFAEENCKTRRVLSAKLCGMKQSKAIKALIICACTVAMFNAAANAADISWGAPTTISGTSDVSLHGTLVGTWGPGDDWGGFNRSDYYPVNGVTFAAYGNGPFGSWVNTSGRLAYGTGASGTGPGQYILGTFVADGGTETLALNASGGADIGPSAQINLLQLRDITPRPNVTWQAPHTISGAPDVSTLGTYFGSWAPQDGSANSYPVNGVTFQGFSDLPYFTSGPTFDAGYNGYGSPNTPDSNYNTLLQYARYSNEGSTPATFSWSGMTPGNTYLIQLWVNDGRNIGQSRSETVTGGDSTSAPLSFGSNGTGPGQYVIGTFVADNSGSQTLILTAFSSGPDPESLISLFQVRDITST